MEFCFVFTIIESRAITRLDIISHLNVLYISHGCCWFSYVVLTFLLSWGETLINNVIILRAFGATGVGNLSAARMAAGCQGPRGERVCVTHDVCCRRWLNVDLSPVFLSFCCVFPQLAVRLGPDAPLQPRCIRSLELAHPLRVD